MYSNKTLLVTGGTGSFGKHFIKSILKKFSDVKKIIIYSRDELKQFDMANSDEFRPYSDKLRFFIGDVRDATRLKRACEEVDYIVHAAALKQVPAAEYNPLEFIKTNINGAENLINAALDSGVQKVVALSTDKAAAPINLYGATKLCSDKLFIAANNIKGKRNLMFSVVRYGNVMGSRGSVIPFFLSKRNAPFLPITDTRMTRFNITLDEGVALVEHALEKSWGGELFVPKIPSYKILDVAEAIAPNLEKREVGIRPGEKIHEEMITETDSYNTLDCGKYFVIKPTHTVWKTSDFMDEFNAKPVETGFQYNSGKNTEWLTVDQIRQLIHLHVDSSFKI